MTVAISITLDATDQAAGVDVLHPSQVVWRSFTATVSGSYVLKLVGSVPCGLGLFDSVPKKIGTYYPPRGQIHAVVATLTAGQEYRFAVAANRGAVFAPAPVSWSVIGPAPPPPPAPIAPSDLPIIDPAASYVKSAGVLIGAGGPVLGDIIEGETGDCWLLAALAALILARKALPITPTHTANLWAVNLHPLGQTSSVKFLVDRWLPQMEGSLIYAGEGRSVTDPATVLWPALIEKAFCDLNGEDLMGHIPAEDSYAALTGGGPGLAAAMLTGGKAEFSAELTTAALGNALAASQLPTLCSLWPTTDADVVPGHAYAVVSVAGTLVTLFNPWGLQGGYWNGVFCPGLLLQTQLQLATNFVGWCWVQ